jgi:dihydrofolate reductase
VSDRREVPVRRVVATLFASVDGYASDAPSEDMSWVTDEFGEQMSAFGLAQLRATDTLVLGRVTYELLASQWRSAREEDDAGFMGLMNDIPKVVVSTTLKDEDLTWDNTRVARGDLSEEIMALKEAPGKDIGVAGSVDLVSSLMGLGLNDRLQLQIHPVVLGPHGGKAIFDGYRRTDLRLVETTVLDDRVVVLDYKPL